ncbi:hypothetical protein N5C12_09830 [Comamonas aquatica]|uniref:hypothetical protein n=1 Tax=Comamonas aquatica TaxID=225991 RepID=UPI00244729F5|nr:hypothetical protein [Comamonas aquatica]MDH0899650.1 hypothetical protein [Comamonas aquatica]
MTPPIPLQRLPRKRHMKPATVRALFWGIAITCFALFCAGVIAKLTTNPVFLL